MITKLALNTNLITCHISCIINKPIINSNMAGKNFHIKKIAIKVNSIDIL